MDFSRSKNKNTVHPTTRHTYWSSAILSLHRAPSEEIIGVILKLLKSDVNINQRLKSNNGDVHSALLLVSGLFSEKSSNISENIRWRTLDTLLRAKSLSLVSYDNNSYPIMIRDLIWKYKTDTKDCKNALDALRMHTGDTSSSPVPLFNEQE